jgi:hypothetical protein
MNFRFWQPRNVCSTLGVLFSVIACQTAPNSPVNDGNSEAPSAVVSALARGQSPVITLEPETISEPISLTPVSEGHEQVAVQASTRAVPRWADEGELGIADAPVPDGFVSEPARLLVAAPCDEYSESRLSASAGGQTVDQRPVGQDFSSPRLSSLTRQVPGVLHSPTLRALTRRFLGEFSGSLSMQRATIDDQVPVVDAATDDQLHVAIATTDDELRLAEQAAALGRMSLIQLRRIYQQFPFTPEELSAPLSDAKQDNSPRRRALLFRAATGQQVPTAIAEVLKIALELARPQGLYELTVGLYGPYIQQFKASFALRWIAYEAGPAQFYLGEFCKGKKWRRYLENIAPNDQHARKALKRYWVLEALSGVVDSSKIEQEDIKTWLRTVTTQDPGKANREIRLTYWMLDALGVQLTVGNWDAVLSSWRSQEVRGQLAELVQAAAQSQQYEVVALAAILIGNRPLRQVPPYQMAKILSALAQVGLAEDARRLAVEVAISSQI